MTENARAPRPINASWTVQLHAAGRTASAAQTQAPGTAPPTPGTAPPGEGSASPGEPQPAEALPPASLAVERGEDPSLAVIAFTGFGGRLSMPAFDFLGATGLLRHSRILLRDASRTLFLGGIAPIAPSFDLLLARLRDAIAELAPQRTMAIGNSGGSHAALLFGHLLEVDVVHAFAPFTNVEPQHIRGRGLDARLQRHADVVDILEALPPEVHRLFDLRNTLAHDNRRTRFHVHVCGHSPREVERAAHIEDLPGVTVHRHACEGHGVVKWLARTEQLLPILRGERAPAPPTG